MIALNLRSVSIVKAMLTHLQIEQKMDATRDENKFKNTDLLQSLRLTLKIMILSAYWLPKNATKLQIAYFILMTIITTTVSLVTELAFLIFKAKSLEDIIDCSFLLLTHTVQTLKFISFYVERKKVLALLDLLESDLFKPKNLRQYKAAMNIQKHTNRFCYVMLVVLALCVVFFLALPLLEKHDAKQLPVRTAWPFNWLETHYELLYAYQTFTLTAMSFANASADLTAASFMSQVCVQLEILSDDLVSIKEVAEKKLMKTENGDVLSPELQEEMNVTLNKCVQYHLTIVKFAKDMESVFSIPIFFQLFTAVGTICMTLFQMSLLTDFFTVRFVALSLYMWCMVAEISLFCWYGNEITVRSEKLSTSLYKTDWVGCNIAYQKKVLFVMMHMQRVIRIRVGNLIDLSLDNLVAVYRTSWSYFLVLHNMRD